MVKALVYAADLTDRRGGQRVLEASPHLGEILPRLRHLWVDSAYQGSFKTWVEQTLGWTVAVVKRPSRWVWVPADQEPSEMPAGLQVLPRCWVVERTLGWLGRWRGTSKEYEFLPKSSECVIYAVMSRLMLRRLADSAA